MDVAACPQGLKDVREDCRGAVNMMRQIVANMITRHISTWPQVVVVNDIPKIQFYTHCAARQMYVGLRTHGNTHVLEQGASITVGQIVYMKSMGQIHRCSVPIYGE